MSAIWTIARGAFRRLLPFFIAALLVGVALVPLFALLCSTYGASGADPVIVGWIDHDQSATSSALRQYCAQDLGYSVGDQSDPQSLNDQLVNHELSVIVTVPAGFERALVRSGAPLKRSDKPQVVYHKELANSSAAASQVITVTYTQNYQNLEFVRANLGQYLTSLKSLSQAAAGSLPRYQSLLAKLPAATPQLSVQTAGSGVSQTEAELSSFQQVIGFYASFSFMMLIGLAFAVYADRRDGTFSRMRLSGVPVPFYLVGVCLAGLTLNIVMLLPLLVYFVATSMAALFALGPLLLLCLVYALFCIGFALLIGLAVSGSGGIAAIQIGAGVILSMLGGLYWPISFVPAALQTVGHFTPQYWLANGLAQISAGAGGGSGSWPLSCLIVLLFALLVFIICGLRVALRRRSA
ncbi:MAG: ABC transporter permease [Coriobacteriales bacterium]|jgi:ABC-2 type transport system permease protein|nr:ABC transporter permease [Coriobacteriales bacterium]